METAENKIMQLIAIYRDAGFDVTIVVQLNNKKYTRYRIGYIRISYGSCRHWQRSIPFVADSADTIAVIYLLRGAPDGIVAIGQRENWPELTAAALDVQHRIRQMDSPFADLALE